MWLVVGMASSKKAAQEMQQALEGEGILVKLRNVSSKSKDGQDTYEILVLESEASQAREILLENGLL
jgi:flavodoxin